MKNKETVIRVTGAEKVSVETEGTKVEVLIGAKADGDSPEKKATGKRVIHTGKKLPPEILEAKRAQAKIKEDERVYNQFMGTQEWKILRAEVRERDMWVDVYVYVMTGDIVILEEGTANVHHMEPATPGTPGWDKRLDPDNCVTMSAKSHRELETLIRHDPEAGAKVNQALREAVATLEYTHYLKD